MDSQALIIATADQIRSQLSGEGSGHDWWHIWRVWNWARRLAQSEGANLLICELGALLHDIADWKFHGGDTTIGPRKARAWLESQGASADLIEAVTEIIATLSFKGAGVPTPMASLEGQIVQDADRLDAIGALGIARAFAFGGHLGTSLYDPEVLPELHMSFEAYRAKRGPTLNHFYEKLLLLKDRMNTSSARQIAAKRHWFMEQFLEQFLQEWEGQR